MNSSFEPLEGSDQFGYQEHLQLGTLLNSMNRITENSIEIDRRFQSWRLDQFLLARRRIGIRAHGTGGDVLDELPDLKSITIKQNTEMMN